MISDHKDPDSLESHIYPSQFDGKFTGIVGPVRLHNKARVLYLMIRVR